MTSLFIKENFVSNTGNKIFKLLNYKVNFYLKNFSKIDWKQHKQINLLIKVWIKKTYLLLRGSNLNTESI